MAGTNPRNPKFTLDEDIHHVHVYLDISQDPIVGINQSKDKFWERVRSLRSVRCRWAAIKKEVKKFNGCIRQTENHHQNGISERDIVYQAKELMMQDKDYNK